MKRKLGVILLFLVAFSSTAFAIADKIPYSAFVRDAGDTPMQGQHNFIFSIFNVTSGGDPMWNESQRIELQNGILSHVLGSVTPFPTDLFLTGDEFYLQVSIDGIPSSNRAYLGMYPHARLAQYLGANGTILGNVTVNGTATFDSITVGNLTVLNMLNLPNNSITNEMIFNLSASKLFNLSALDQKILVSAFNVTPGNFTGNFNFTGNVTINDTLIARILSATNIYQNGYLVLDRNTNFAGDVSGIWNNIQVADDSHYHSDSTLSSLNANKLFNLPSLYNKIQISADNVTAGTFFGTNYVFNGSVMILGNLSVVNITSVNVTNLNVNGSFVPSINNIFDIGSPSYLWANGYFNNLYANNLYSAGNSVLTNVSQFGGDVSGPYDNLKVYWPNGSYNILISQENISSGLIIPWNNVTGNPGVTLDINANTTGLLSWARVNFPGISIPQANISTGITVPWLNVSGYPGVSIPQSNITTGIIIPASNVTAGTFGIGNFDFPGNLNVTDKINTNGLNLTVGGDSTGDVYYRDSTGYMTRLGIGSGHQVLTISNSSLPIWDNIPVPGEIIYYFRNDVSDITTYFNMSTNLSTLLTTYTSGSLSNGLDSIKNFSTVQGAPNIIFIPQGEISLHLHASKPTGGHTVSLYADIYRRNSTGVETLIGHSEDTGTLSATEIEYDIHLPLSSPYILNLSDRIVAKIIANVTGVGAAPTVSLFIGDSSDSHLSLPSQAVDVSNFVPYSGAANNLNMGIYDVIAANFFGNIGWGNISGYPGTTLDINTNTTGLLAWSRINFPGLSIPQANITTGISIPQSNISTGITIPATNVTNLPMANESGISRNGTFSLSSNNNTLYVPLSGGDIIHIKGVVVGTTLATPLIFTINGDVQINYAYRRIQSYRLLQQAITVNPQTNVTMEGYDWSGNRTVEISIYKNANGVTGEFTVTSASDNLVGSISGNIVATNSTVGMFTWRNLTSAIGFIEIRPATGNLLAGSYMIETSEAK